MANVLDQSLNPTTNFGFILRYASNNGVKLAQGFTPTISAGVGRIDLKLKKNGTPTGNIWVTIETDNAGVPSGTSLGQSSNVDVSTLGAEAFVTFSFASPTSPLTAESPYWIVLQGDYTASSTDDAELRSIENAVDQYTRGQVSANDGTSWTNQNGGGNFYDAGFKEYYDDTTIVRSGGSFLLNFI